LANNSTPVSLVQPKTFADANDQFLAWSPASGNDVIVPVQNLFSNVPLVVGTTITVGNASGVVINTTAVSVNGVIIAAGGGYAGGNLIPSGDDAQVIGNATNRFLSLNIGNTITIGNSTVVTTINTTAFSGQANNALFIGNLAAANVVSNAQLAANLTQFQPTVTLGAAIAVLTANAANFIGSLPAASVANTSAPAFTTSMEVGNVANNVLVTPTSLKVGNSTVNATMNSTSFTGTSNNALFIGATSAANVVSNAQLAANLTSYTPTANLATAVAGLSVNNATNLAGLPASDYANTSNATITAIQTVNLSVSNQVSFGPNQSINTTAIFTGNTTVFQKSNAVATVLSSPTSNVSLNSDAILIGNATVSSLINATSFTGTANNTLFIGAISAANVVSNAQLAANLSAFQSQAGLTANVAKLTANNALFLGGLAAVNYANTSAPTVGTIEIGSVANNVFVNSTMIAIGNSTVNNVINSTSYTGTAFFANDAANLGGLPAADYANNSSPIFSANISIGANVSVNTSAIFIGPTTELTGNGLTTVTLNISNLVTSTIIANGQSGLSGQALLSGGPGSNVFWGTVSSNGGGGSGNGVYGSFNSIAYNNNGTETGDATLTWQSTNTTLTVGSIGNTVTITPTSITIGNSSSNATVNSTFFSGKVNTAINAIVANNALNLGGILAANYANTSNAVIASAIINTISVGNASSVAIINSTVYSATSNNVLFVGSTSAANVVSNAQLAANVALLQSTLQTTAGLAANVAKLTANSASFIGTLPAASVANTSTPQITTSVKVGANVSLSTNNLTIGTTTVLDANQLIVGNVVPTIIVANGSVGLTGQSLLSAGPGSNVYWGTVSSNSGSGNGVYGNPNQIAYNNNGTETGDANFTWQSTNTLLSVGSGLANTQFTPTLGTWANTTDTTVIGSGNATLSDVSNNFISLNTQVITLSDNSNITTINTSAFSGTANNALNLGGLAPTSYANNSTPLITTSVTVGNATVNSTINATSFTGTTNNTLFVGSIPAANVVSNAQLAANLAAFQTTAGLATAVSSLAANDASFLGGQAAANYANTSSPVITTSVEVGAAGNSVTANTTVLKIGNSTVSSTINSTAFSGIANDTLFVGTISAANVVSNAQLSANLAAFQTTAGLTLAVAALAANSASFIGTLPAASVANTSAPVFTTSVEVGSGGTANNTTILPASVSVGNSTVNSSMTPTTFSGTANNATNLGGLSAANYANTSAPVISTTLEVGAAGNNVTANTTAVKVGNSTVFSTINSTTFTGTANNATNLNGLPATSYANTSAPNFSTSAQVGANVVITTSTITIGNTSVGTTINATMLNLGGQIVANGSTGTQGQFLTTNGATGSVFWSTGSTGGGAIGSDTQIAFNNAGTESGDANLTWNTVGAILTIGGPSVNVQISDTSFSGISNDSLNLGGLPANGYANTTTPVIANTLQIGTGFSNGTQINSTAIFVGNTTVSSVVNSTFFTGTANNATNLGGLMSSNYANTSAATITTLTTTGLTIGNSTVNTTSNSTTLTVANVVTGRLTANGGLGTAGQVLISGGATGNSSWQTFTAAAVGANTQIAFNNSGVEAGDANLTWSTTNAKLTVGNSTVFTTVNSTAFSGVANNATNLGGLPAADYANTTVANFSTSANVGSVSQINTTAITIGNATAQFTANSSVLKVPGQISANGSTGTASFVLTSGGASGNVFWNVASTGGTPGGQTTQIQFNQAGAFDGDANLTWQTSNGLLTVGNSTVFATINSTVQHFGTVNATSLTATNITATANVSANNLSVLTLGSFGNSTVNTTVNSTVVETGGTMTVANSVKLTNGSVTINNAVVPTMGMVYGIMSGYALI
jgi:trimeric autotransporter adhesin